ncbi:MAG: T9SS type A sorting domain-containing protein [Calditrichaeota bacterium]|nr:T9SS type A sorting domain-containing protein [Calditrichota bacterium]
MNVVNNGGFENWTGNLPESWELKSTDISMIQETTTVHSGIYSAKVEFTSTTTQKIGQTISNITGNTQYTFNIWVFDNDPASRFRIWGYWNIAGGGSVTLDPGNVYTTDDPNWQLYTYETTSPADAISLDFEMRLYDVAPFPGLGTIYVDDVEILGPSVNAPVISNVLQEPFQAGSPINITCDVSVSSGSIDSVYLYYYTDFNINLRDSAEMSLTTGSTYSVTLPQLSNGTSLIYWVEAWGNSQNTRGGANKVVIGTADMGIFHTQLDADGLPLHMNHLARIRGIATVSSGVFATDRYDFYMQDNTGGINVFSFNYHPDSTRYLEGDSLEVIGVIDAYNGKVEIVDFEAVILSRGNPLPAPIDVNIEDMGEEFEGRLISIDNVTPGSGGDPWPSTPQSANINITDGSGTLILRIQDSTYIGGNPEPSWPLTVVGIGNQYDTSPPYFEAYQIQPRSYGDFVVTGIGDKKPVAYTYRLGQNYPNPFNPVTKIPFELKKAGEVDFRIFNIIGQEVYQYTGYKTAGPHEIAFNGRKLPSGIYFYRFSSGDFSTMRKMVLVK